MRHLIHGLLALLTLGLPATAEVARYDVTLQGIRVAEMTLTTTLTETTYDIRVMIRSEGMAGVVKRIRFESTATGRIRQTFAPDRYTETADTGRRQSQVEMTYTAGTPTVLTYTSPRPDGPEVLDPADQTGSFDPATALFAGLRDLRVGQTCTTAFTVFDGRRRAAVTLSGDGSACTGEYRRVAGYTAEELAERTRFALEILYTPEGDTLRVTEASVQTIYGKVRLKRR